jgi:hypothetical protein
LRCLLVKSQQCPKYRGTPVFVDSSRRVREYWVRAMLFSGVSPQLDKMILMFLGRCLVA